MSWPWQFQSRAVLSTGFSINTSGRNGKLTAFRPALRRGRPTWATRHEFVQPPFMALTRCKRSRHGKLSTMSRDGENYVYFLIRISIYSQMHIKRPVEPSIGPPTKTAEHFQTHRSRIPDSSLTVIARAQRLLFLCPPSTRVTRFSQDTPPSSSRTTTPRPPFRHHATPLCSPGPPSAPVRPRRP